MSGQGACTNKLQCQPQAAQSLHLLQYSVGSDSCGTAVGDNQGLHGCLLVACGWQMQCSSPTTVVTAVPAAARLDIQVLHALLVGPTTLVLCKQKACKQQLTLKAASMPLMCHAELSNCTQHTRQRPEQTHSLYASKLPVQNLTNVNHKQKTLRLTNLNNTATQRVNVLATPMQDWG